jgi:hypothetical protein
MPKHLPTSEGICDSHLRSGAVSSMRKQTGGLPTVCCLRVFIRHIRSYPCRLSGECLLRLYGQDPCSSTLGLRILCTTKWSWICGFNAVILVHSPKLDMILSRFDQPLLLYITIWMTELFIYIYDVSSSGIRLVVLPWGYGTVLLFGESVTSSWTTFIWYVRKYIMHKIKFNTICRFVTTVY